MKSLAVKQHKRRKKTPESVTQGCSSNCEKLTPSHTSPGIREQLVVWVSSCYFQTLPNRRAPDNAFQLVIYIWLQKVVRFRGKNLNKVARVVTTTEKQTQVSGVVLNCVFSGWETQRRAKMGSFLQTVMAQNKWIYRAYFKNCFYLR